MLCNWGVSDSDIDSVDRRKWNTDQDNGILLLLGTPFTVTSNPKPNPSTAAKRTFQVLISQRGGLVVRALDQ